MKTPQKTPKMAAPKKDSKFYENLAKEYAEHNRKLEEENRILREAYKDLSKINISRWGELRKCKFEKINLERKLLKIPNWIKRWFNID